MEVKEINHRKFIEVMKQKDKLIVIDFFAPWCGPCQFFKPVMNEAAEIYKDIDFYFVNVDVETELAIEQKVEGVPTVIFFKNGKIVNNFSGFLPIEDFEKEIEKAKKESNF